MLGKASIPARIKGLSLKKQLGLALTCGIFSTLALPPLFLWPVLFLTLPPMLWLIDAATSTQSATQNQSLKTRLVKAALYGWAFGMGYFSFSLYWIGNSFLVEAEKYAWAMPFAVIGLPALIAWFYGLATAICASLWPKGAERLIIFALAIMAVDTLRSIIFTGFPWTLIGHSLTGNQAFMQSVSVFGLYGLSAIAAFIFASPACLYARDHNLQSKVTGWQPIAPFMLAIITLGTLYGFGYYRLSLHKSFVFEPDLELILIQPNIPQTEKVNPKLRINALQKTLKMTEQALIEAQNETQTTNPSTKRIIIWPETAIPFALNEATEIQERIASLLSKGDQLITGAYKLERAKDKTGNRQVLKVYNSLFVLDDQGKIKASYDKHHLVPFGEYLPFPKLLAAIGFKAMVRVRSGFSQGKPPTPLPLAAAPAFLPSICYEAIFPLTLTSDIQAAKWLLNISNDGWFGKTAGPYQHAHMVRMRTLEVGLPIVRVVNGGISGVYDGLGREISTTKLGQKTSLKIKLPKPVAALSKPLNPLILTLLFLLMSFVLIIILKIFDKTHEIN